MVAQATPTVERPGTPWEWTLEGKHIGREADFIHNCGVFCLTEWYSIPVNQCLRSMELPVMGRHGPGCQLHPEVRTRDAQTEALPVSPPIPSAPLTEGLL